MKNSFLAIAVGILFLAALSSCHSHNTYVSDGNMSISVKESDDEYRFSASFDKDKTKEVQAFIADATNNALFDKGNIEIDATTNMDDNTRFYIRAYPGKLKIQVDKEENSEASYERVKDMCEGIKEIITGEEDH